MSTSAGSLHWLPAAPSDFSQRLKAVDVTDRDSLPTVLGSLAAYDLSGPQLVNLSKRVLKLIRDGSLGKPLEKIRLAVLSNSTISFAADMIPAAALRHGLAADILSIEYEQIVPAAMGSDSRLTDFQPDLVLLAIDHRGLPLTEVEPGGDATRYRAVALEHLMMLGDMIRSNLEVPVVFQTVPTPNEPLFGSFDIAIAGTWRSVIADLNRALVDAAVKSKDFVLDVAALAETVGLRQWFDEPQWHAHKLPFSLTFAPLFADHVGRLLGAIRGRSRKCLVLDLDNTVWGGAVGDEGVAGIVLGQGSAEGEAFLSVQRLALRLRERGIVLAVSSKNDFANAIAPFREHPEMLLREKHIAVFQANWMDKATNLEAIAKTLNLGMDALVLLDDNPAERAQLRAALPMVAVPELPDDPSQFAGTLAAAGYFEAVTFSSEDRERAEAYSSENKRLEVRAQARDLGEYLSQLHMVATMQPFDDIGRVRIAQLVNKTNQFNLTTQRYTEAQIEEFQRDPNVFTLQARLRDRYGDSGMIAVIIAKATSHDKDPAWLIDTWLMSCRVLGRKVEEALFNEICEAAKARGIRWLLGRYVPTAKNSMVKDHYKSLGLQLIGETDQGTTEWRLDLSNFTPSPVPMRIERSDAALAVAS